MRCRWLLLCTLSFLLEPATARADGLVPFYTFNQSPFVQIFGLPVLGSSQVLATGQRRVLLAYEAANHFIRHSNAEERLFVDGESHRLTLALDFGRPGGLELGLELPYVSHSGGYLDSLIESWHETFDLPQNRRDELSSDRITYYYQRGDAVVLNIDSPTSGAGDLRLTIGQQLLANIENYALALRGSLKLPTGDPDELRGSGATDAAAWLVWGCQRACPEDIAWQLAGGFLWLGDGEVLPDQQRSGAYFGGAALEWRAWPRLALKVEINAHSPMYSDTRFATLGDPAAQLVFGGTWNITPDTAVDVAMTEDIAVETAPDVSFIIALRSLF